ncbi:MAG: lipoyl synthase [Actinomycetota bacterium]
MPARDHNPHKRRLYLPIIPTNGRTATTEPVPGRPARRPEWLKVRAKTSPDYLDLKRVMHDRDLHTVCEEANCPNIYECWADREATFLILGDRCTRRCGFCDVMTAKPVESGEGEPERVADAVREMGLRYVVLTGVARDDLPDGGASVWAACIRAIRGVVPGCGIEVLPTDFRERARDIPVVIREAPEVFAHNLETVRRLHPRIRPAFDYDGSLEALRIAKRSRNGQVTKSNLILGMGERPDEIREAMRDLREARVDVLTIGQYLQPSRYHLPVDRWVTPQEFADHAHFGTQELDFAHVEAGPLVRSSYRAGRQYSTAAARLTPSPSG